MAKLFLLPPQAFLLASGPYAWARQEGVHTTLSDTDQL